jgi:hypothetical protein
VIAVHSNSFRTVRGRTLIAAIFDEVAFWRDETSATPDVEVYRAVLPSLATTQGMLIGISTPYRKLGLLHQKHRDHFGENRDDVLVVQGGTQAFNPTLSDATIAAQRLVDPTAATSEWDAEFRTDICSFLDDQLIDAAVEPGRPVKCTLQEGCATANSGNILGATVLAREVKHNLRVRAFLIATFAIIPILPAAVATKMGMCIGEHGCILGGTW